MDKKVIVNLDIPKYMPIFENPLYNLVIKQKENVRREIINRIKNGKIDNGLKDFYLLLDGFRENEVKDILEYWYINDYFLLINCYYNSLINNNLDDIIISDNKYLDNMKKMKKIK